MSAPRYRIGSPPTAAPVRRRTATACGTAHTEPIGRASRLLQIGVLATLLGAGACARPARPPVTAPPAPPSRGSGGGPLLVRLPAEASGKVVPVALEAYVAGALAGEQAVGSLPPAIASRVLELQAIISRTYAVANRDRHAREGFDLCSETHCQVFRPGVLAGERRARVDNAVATTAGLVVTYGGRPIQALFHSDCGGHTSAATDVWGGPPQPYLVARPDPWCATRAASAWTLQVTLSEVRQALASDRTLAGLGDIRSLDVGQIDAGGRASTLVVRGSTPLVVRGEDFRRALTTSLGPRSLRSLKFTVERTQGGLVFRGRGFGHGAGLCQAGALARLQAGATVREVLGYYYPGTSLSTWGSGLYF